MDAPFKIDVGQRVRAMPGENVAGDLCYVHSDRSAVLLALIDGLGHGEAAAIAARICAESFREHVGLGLAEMLALAHRAVRGTRGVVATVVRIRPHERVLDVAGVGNVSAVLFRDRPGTQRAVALITPGALGSAFRSASVQRLPFELGDLLVVHSDGVRSRFDALSMRLVTAQAAAEELVATHGKASDDASCLVARAIPPDLRLLSQAPASEGGAERTLDLRRLGDAQVAALEARQFAKELGFPTRDQWEIGIVAAELASNAVKYGGEGVLCLRRLGEGSPELVLEVTDRGQRHGSAEGSDTPGLGVGLESVRRLMDSVASRRVEGLGTRVIARRRLRA